MKQTAKTTAGIRTANFSDALLFLSKVLNLPVAHYDEEHHFAQFILPSGEILEVYGSRNIWQPFTSPPDWEVVIAEIRHREEQD